MTISASGPATNTATCPAGKTVVGGGYSESTGHSMLLLSEGPTTVNSANDSWTVRADRVAQSSNAIYTVTAICITAA